MTNGYYDPYSPFPPAQSSLIHPPQHRSPEEEETPTTAFSPREQELQTEIAQLRNRLVRAEFHHEQDLQRLRVLQDRHELEQPLNREVDERFNMEWAERTEARISKLCSLNRAGNALCQW
jgi:hypothetical protein